jgi:putative SOS response-associated peptidase YedK
MCGRFYIPEGDLDDFAGLVSKIEKELLKKAGEIFPGDYAPVITPNKSQQDSTADNPGILPSSSVHAIKWGFPVMKGRPIINARSETVKEKPLFKLPYANRRCLIPARGFFEWKDAENSRKRIKHYITLIDSSMMYLAGLYWFFKDKEGIQTPYFTILTTQANEDIRNIHDRMPVIVKSDHKDIWLNEKNIEIVDSLLKPLEEGELKVEIVG